MGRATAVRAHLSRNVTTVKGSTGPNTIPKPTMSLVQYPDSDSDSEDKAILSAQKPKAPLKRKRSEPSSDDLPPLPAAFHDLYSTAARVSTSDNPSLHGGRQRAVPHVEGNWPTHVYLECKDDPAPFPESGLAWLMCSRGSFAGRV